MARPRALSVRPVRWLVQLAFAAFILWSSYQHQVATAPSTDALCPFGAVETVWTFLRSGSLIQKTHPSNLVLGIALALSAVTAGAVFCGWVCPFGALQDLLTGLRQRLHLPQLRVPAGLDQMLRWGRLVMLVGIPALTIYTGTLWFASYDPYRTIFSLHWLLEFNPAEGLVGYAIAGAVVIGSLFIPRFWCRYLCPQGLLLEWLSGVSILRIWRNKATCINCKRCDKVCPANITVSAVHHTNAAGHCTGCLDCIESCPVAGTLYVGSGMAKDEVTHTEEAVA